MRTCDRSGRSGVSLIELLIVMTLIGILAGIALPQFHNLINRADAARVVSDMTTVRGALFQTLASGAPFPESGDWGTAPPDLSLYLDQMTFTYKEVEYRFSVNPDPLSAQFDVRYPEGSPIGEALQSYRRPGDEVGSVAWTSTQTKFILYNDAPLVVSVDPAAEPAPAPAAGGGKGKSDQGQTKGKSEEAQTKGKGKGGG